VLKEFLKREGIMRVFGKIGSGNTSNGIQLHKLFPDERKPVPWHMGECDDQGRRSLD